MRTSTLFGAKTSDFSKYIVCPHEQGGRGLSQCGHFVGKEEGGNFSRFCADVFYGRSLIEKTNFASVCRGAETFLDRVAENISFVLSQNCQASASTRNVLWE